MTLADTLRSWWPWHTDIPDDFHFEETRIATRYELTTTYHSGRTETTEGYHVQERPDGVSYATDPGLYAEPVGDTLFLHASPNRASDEFIPYALCAEPPECTPIAQETWQYACDVTFKPARYAPDGRVALQRNATAALVESVPVVADDD